MVILEVMPLEQVKNADKVPIQDASTLVLMRDAPTSGVEIFMVRRNQRTAFGPGDYVFPGGAVDAADIDAALYAGCVGLDDAQASARLSVHADGLSAWIAAIRECFEEAGVLLAVDAAGRPAHLEETLVAERTALHERKTILGEVCNKYDLKLAVNQMRYYSHWITPLGPPRRYSTRFFAARVPAGQTAAHDGVETVAGEWVTPQDALARSKQGNFPIIFPTISQLRFFRGFADTQSALDALARIKQVPTVAPYLERDARGNLRPVLPKQSHGN